MSPFMISRLRLIGSALGQRARYGIAESGWNTASVAFPSLNVVVLKPTFCQMPRTLARWLKGGSGQLRCDCEIKSLNTQAAVSTAGTLLSSLNGRRYEGGWGNNGTLSKELPLLLPCLASNYHQHHPNTHWGDA